MRLVRRYGPLDDRRVDVLANDVEFADSLLEQARGLMFRSSIPEDYALVFRFDEPAPRSLHMLFVPFAIDALWVRGPEVVHRKRLRPFVGIGRASADLVVELPAGAADDVRPGDVVELVDGNDSDDPLGEIDTDDPLGESDSDDPLGESDSDEPPGESDSDDPLGESDSDEPPG